MKGEVSDKPIKASACCFSRLRGCDSRKVTGLPTKGSKIMTAAPKELMPMPPLLGFPHVVHGFGGDTGVSFLRACLVGFQGKRKEHHHFGGSLKKRHTSFY